MFEKLGKWFDNLFKSDQKHDYYAVYTPTQPTMRFDSLKKARKYEENYISQNPHLSRYTNIYGYDQKDLDDSIC